MDYKTAIEFDKGVVIKNVLNFELKDIFDCGQCFRWHKQTNDNYIGVAFEKVIEVEKKDQDVIIYNTNLDDFKNIWLDYFDLNRNYGEIKDNLSKDSILKTSVLYGTGIRILRQDPFETLISFIISSNNRIPMIKRAIENISSKWGKKIEYNNNIYFTFPTPEDLLCAEIKDFEACSTGFRAKYIKDTVLKVYENMKQSKEFDLKWIKNQPDDFCHEELKKFSGVGPKVADCIMLFSMQKYSAFPVDVWVKKAMIHFYLAPDLSLKKIRDFGRDKFGDLSGFAQQYLFYYARENHIEI